LPIIESERSNKPRRIEAKSTRRGHRWDERFDITHEAVVLSQTIHLVTEVEIHNL
jgi:hypothetical protein